VLQRGELDEVLLSPEVVVRLEGLNQDGTLAEMFPEVHAMVGFGGGDTGHKDLWGHTKQVVAQTLRVPHLRWAALFHDVGKPSCFTKEANGEVSFHLHEGKSARLFNQAASRTKLFTREERDLIYFLIRNLGHVEAYEPHWTDSAVRRLRVDSQGHLDDLLALARADITTKHANKRAAHHQRMKELKDRVEDLTALDSIPPALPTGLGLRITAEFGIPPGPPLGRALGVLKAAVEAGHLPRQADPQVLVDYLRANMTDLTTVKPSP
jgi:poly(A) polymerase